MSLVDQFDRAAERYDLLTRLNPGYHAALRRAAGALVGRLGQCSPRATPNGTALRLWDLGCGSGLSSQALLDAATEACGSSGPDAVQIVGLDASPGMLGQARSKDWPAGVRFLVAMAQDLRVVAARELEGPADGVFAAYLLRNVPADQRDAVLVAIFDQLRPGGWIALQDYHVKGNRLAQVVWTVVCWGVVIPLALVVRGNPEIHRYLWRSVIDNHSPADLQARLGRAGFDRIEWSTERGWQRGILHTVLAQRPEV